MKTHLYSPVWGSMDELHHADAGQIVVGYTVAPLGRDTRQTLIFSAGAVEVAADEVRDAFVKTVSEATSQVITSTASLGTEAKAIKQSVSKDAKAAADCGDAAQVEGFIAEIDDVLHRPVEHARALRLAEIVRNAIDDVVDFDVAPVEKALIDLNAALIEFQGVLTGLRALRADAVKLVEHARSPAVQHKLREAGKEVAARSIITPAFVAQLRQAHQQAVADLARLADLISVVEGAAR
ncbi:hypothetical protein [Azospirillum thermophilum]|uniref:Uncharacterized protein n=1 Tax=Azospirillum thermophilum TaxID=2202148 RepID=A0A2S2CT38_9PROT|nr:hypothetical protein [Azospirillum thermophilum]AWK87662.1 hypothetical protein DEW08_16860 [Azospirillum thermophilum]